MSLGEAHFYSLDRAVSVCPAVDRRGRGSLFAMKNGCCYTRQVYRSFVFVGIWALRLAGLDLRDPPASTAEGGIKGVYPTPDLIMMPFRVMYCS